MEIQMHPDPDETTRKGEFAIKELQSLRDARSADLARLSTSITKYHFVRVVVFSVVALLISGSSFSEPEWRLQNLALTRWVDQYASSPYVLKFPYREFASSSHYSKAERDALSETIKRSPEYRNLDPASDMEHVAAFLGVHYYGINPLKLPELLKQIQLIRDQKGAITLEDLNNYHYEGGPFVQGTRLKDSFFNDIITKHPLLAQNFPYAPGRSVGEYLDSLLKNIHEIVQPHAQDFALWAKYTDDYDFDEWNWYVWDKLPTEALRDWESRVLTIFGAVSEDVIESENNKNKMVWGPSLGAIVSHFNNIIKDDIEAEKQSRQKLNLGTISVAIPIGFVFVSFPILFFGGRALFVAMQTERTLVAVDLSKLNVEIAKLAGIPPLSLFPKERMLTKSPYGLIFGRQYRELFSTFPNFFVEGANGLMATIAGVYALARLYILVFFDGRSILSSHDSLVVGGLSALAIGLEVSVKTICSRALVDTQQS